ncbi:hypothetical protein ET445_00790 [Agromyces protaetiae]|uniref:Uncharacterized protein n=1 Tax=Agromyces protaetiae TaxID=2509455 RepID=A0A4P6F8K4_9MICO|nr:hypothetical protein [Agromyces protaetiae]QAY72084.1 hypothetical protein ET445_00790 [Agromyces protaetiae]
MRRDAASEESRRPTAVSRQLVALVLTYGVGAVLLFLPLGLTIEGIGIANTYAGNPDPTSRGHVDEAILQAALAGSLGVLVLIGCAIVAGGIALRARRNVLVATLGGVILMVLVTLPFSWLLVRPVGGVWLA